ncbi:beta-galactosidase [Striga asiatica]|uniref:Beta-galactosidase n=1 Tax=Striga asiatica TaxID=4170 RepID=A0A5A7PIF0_STRAF|nr:beta-galactosidase [Striga asiatica]
MSLGKIDVRSPAFLLPFLVAIIFIGADAEKMMWNKMEDIVFGNENATAQLLRLLFHDCFIQKTQRDSLSHEIQDQCGDEVIPTMVCIVITFLPIKPIKPRCGLKRGPAGRLVVRLSRLAMTMMHLLMNMVNTQIFQIGIRELPVKSISLNDSVNFHNSYMGHVFKSMSRLQSYNKEAASHEENSFTMVGLLEQINNTRDNTDYLWYTTE